MKIRTVALSGLTSDEKRSLTHRGALPDRSVRTRAAKIIAAVRAGGDRALAEAADLYGGSPTTSQPVQIAPGEIAAAAANLGSQQREALTSARAAIQAAHVPQLPVDNDVEPTRGVVVRRSWTPLHRVAAYVPGGAAAYPSSLLMSVVPARVAGVGEIVVATPAGADGTVPAVVLAAAHMMGVGEVFAMGGAQAVAALAYGTETIEPVEKIVGPGNAWVTAAKLEVSGDVSVDLPAGPSESLIMWDGSVPTRLVATDMLCQAEHGPDSPVVLVTTSPDLLPSLYEHIDRFLPTLDRETVISKALSDHGLVITVEDRDTAISFANAYAAEHVSILTETAAGDAERITAAGSVFVGPWAPESAGDYATGANHILPTGGLARSHSPLGVEEFGSWRQIQYITRDGLSRLRSTVTTLAEAEGLTAHRLAVEARFDDGATL